MLGVLAVWAAAAVLAAARAQRAVTNRMGFRIATMLRLARSLLILHIVIVIHWIQHFNILIQNDLTCHVSIVCGALK